jgi:hypothetical protein
MKTMCLTAEVLAKVRENRTKHAEIVAEAIVGYMAKAKELLHTATEAVERWKPGQKPVILRFDLKYPVDHRGEYDTIIRMLEMHKEEKIELNADEVRQFVMDEWEWMHEFLASNAAYSARARGAIASE